MTIFFLKHRSDALSVFVEFRTSIEKFLNSSIVLLRLDNAPEYIYGQFYDYCKSEGISFEKIVPDASPQNGVSERANLTVARMMRAMLIDGDMPDFFWPLAAACGTHIKNRVPHASLPPATTPFTLWFKRKPDLSHLRPFGCHVTSRRVDSDSLNKVEPRGEPGRFVGYAKDAKGYLIWFPKSRSVLVRRDVVFHDMPHPLPSSSLPLRDGILWEDVPMETTTPFGSPTSAPLVHAHDEHEAVPPRQQYVPTQNCPADADDITLLGVTPAMMTTVISAKRPIYSLSTLSVFSPSLLLMKPTALSVIRQ
jgi:hypothetical protein